jgi:hypothetical protein
MPISNYFDKSTSKPNIVFQLDINKLNVQWVNIGAGIWEVDFNALYPFVDSSLLDGFTTQVFGIVGSVSVDSISQLKVNSLLLVTETNESFYYDSVNEIVYLHLINNDDPIMHNIFLGIVYGYSYKEFTPLDSVSLYEGRVLSINNFNRSRDPLFFGKLSYPSGSIDLINADGFFDTFAEDNNIYGNPARVLIGYDDLSINDYEHLYSGFITNVDISETQATFSFEDKRAQLTKEVLYSCTNKNALDAIVDLLSQSYGYGYVSSLYDITDWGAATLLAPNITINYTDLTSVIDIIEEICLSIFGFFDTTNDGLFTFRFIDTSATASSTIYGFDILNTFVIKYDPSEVLTSINIGYAKDWATSTNPYTYLNDTSKEALIFAKYKTYTAQTFDTLLTNLTDAQTLSDTILDYTKDVHGVLDITLAMKYYNLKIGDIKNVEINRKNNTMLGTKKCEVIGINLDLNTPSMSATIRII